MQNESVKQTKSTKAPNEKDEGSRTDSEWNNAAMVFKALHKPIRVDRWCSAQKVSSNSNFINMLNSTDSYRRTLKGRGHDDLLQKLITELSKESSSAFPKTILSNYSACLTRTL